MSNYRIAGVYPVSGSGATASINLVSGGDVDRVWGFIRGTGATGTITFQSGSMPVEQFVTNEPIPSFPSKVAVTAGIVYLLK